MAISGKMLTYSTWKKQPQTHGHLLTFDDGLADHFETVFPILLARKLSGLFFIPSQPCLERKVLFTHKLHLLSGQFGYDWLEKQFIQVSGVQIKASQQAFFAYPLDNSKVAAFKYALNYQLPKNEIEPFIDHLFQQYFSEEEVVDSFYLNENQIRTMHQAGMKIGLHGHTHTPFSSLPHAALDNEIKLNKQWLESIIDEPCDILSFPFGDNSSVNEETWPVIMQNQVKYTFFAEDIQVKPLSFPRIDCANFHNTGESPL